MITGPEITARHCNQNDVTFDSTHSLVISTNYDPVVHETDHGSWRRLLALRFPYKYWEAGAMPVPPGPFDLPAERGLRERLRDGGEGRGEAVLAWLVDGARAWYAAGERFGPVPPRIAADTAEWQGAANPMFGWVRENLIADAGRHVMTEEISSDFATHLEGSGHPKWSASLIRGRFEEACGALGWHIAKGPVYPGRSTWGGALSQPDAPRYLVPGKKYNAWSGVRFRTAADDDRTAGYTGPHLPAQAADLGITALTGQSGDRVYEEPSEI